MPDLGTLSAKMRLEGSEFMNPLETAKGAMEGFRGVAEKITGVLGALGIGFAAFRSAEGFTEGLKGVFEFGKELEAQKAITGESISNLVVLRQAYKEAGLDAGAVTQSLVMLQTALGGVNDEGQPTKEIFKQLHLNMAQLKGEGAVQQFRAISKAIGGLADQSSKTAAIRAMFGRAGAQMEAVFANPHAIDEAREKVGNLGAVMERNAATFAKISNAFELMGEQGQRFFAGFGEQIAPMLDNLLTKINGIDLTKLGEQVGGAVSKLYGAFKGGDLTKVIGLSFQGGVESGLKLIFDPHTWKGIGDMIKGAFTGLGDIVLDAFKPAFTALGAYVSQAVSDLTGGRVDPQKNQAQQDYQFAIDNMTRLQKEMDDTLDRTDISQAEKDAINKRKEALYDQAKFTRDNAAPMAFTAGPTMADRYNYMATTGAGADLFDAIKKHKGDESGRELADGAKEIEQAMEDVKNFAPDTRDAIKAILDKYAAPAGSGAAMEPGAKGTGRIDPAKLPTAGERKENSVDRFARVGLFIGGAGGPGADYARRTADNTAKTNTLMAGLTAAVNNMAAAMTRTMIDPFAAG